MFFSKRKISRPMIVVMAIILVLLILNLVGAMPPANNLLGRPLVFIQQWLYALGAKINNSDVRVMSKSDLIDLNRDLKEQVVSLTLKLTDLQIYEQENKELVKQLDFLDRQSDYRTVTARIVGRSPDYADHVLIINRGSKDGLAAGYPVIAEEGIIIGKILSADRDQSQVMLLTDSHSKTAATILNQDRTIGLVNGQYGLSLKMELIPQNEEVKINDLVITSGLEESIPKGLLIGKIDHLTTQPNDVFQSALLNLLVDYNKVNIISVILP
ncbi:MAG: rod shape-determining protein MreC [bacterium]